MTTARLQSSYPNEVTPTHYEVRSLVYPSYSKSVLGKDIAHGIPTDRWHAPSGETGTNSHSPIFQHNNLLDALRTQSMAELRRINDPIGYDFPKDNATLDAYSMTTKPNHETHPSASHVVGVYPDKSYFYVDHPEISISADGRHIHVSNIIHGDLDPDDPAWHSHSHTQQGSQHRKLIGALVNIGRNWAMLNPNSDSLHLLREQALREHDPHAFLAAADAIEEAHGHNQNSTPLREAIKAAGIHFKQDKKLRYFKALEKLWTKGVKYTLATDEDLKRRIYAEPTQQTQACLY